MAESTVLAEPEPGTSGRFWRKLDWSAFWTAFALSFIVYFWTLAPTVTLEDSGELAVAGDYLGVPHPPGYPIWTILAWLFSRVFSFVTFRGQPNPAWSIGLLSAVCGSLATAITAMLICRSGSDILKELRETPHTLASREESLICWIGGVVCSLLFAFSPVMWSQSVIVEVYSLNALFLVLIFLLTYEWMCRPKASILYATAFVFGLGLTNYQVLLLAALPLVVAIFLRDLKLFRDFLILGAPFALVLLLVKRGMLPTISHPLDMSCFVYVTLNFLALGLAYFFLPHGRTVALTFLMVEAGVAFYGYMPIVSDLRNPPMNWGYPRTWEGFLHAITRGQYEKISPTDAFSMLFIHQIGSYLTDLRLQYTLLAAPLGFLPFTVWEIRTSKTRIKALYIAIALTIAAVGVAMIEKFDATVGGHLGTVYKLLFGGVLLILGTGVVIVFVNQIKEMLSRLTGKAQASLSEKITTSAVLVGLAAVAGLYVYMLAIKVGDITAPLRKVGESVPSEQFSDIFLQTCGVILLIVIPVVAACVVAWLMQSRYELRLTMAPNSQKWLIATLMGFLVMSLVLIVLANPKGDIQDNFIQRVKFISSHALYAFWIGYGLIFGLAFIWRIFHKHAPIKWTSACVALMLPLIPLEENLSNEELVRSSGGAEQNQHDFGWQFGNYQLRGAEAITEELVPDEEPLPNPAFPRAMGTNAVFFGGTDPGRFVPTYMIYSARVREDVYLITQNALADNTYMSVMRDLYGDQIWIPAQPDSARAFQRYVDEVNSGKRPRNADLTIENGRVQVSGALGVMEINGILAEMIFEHNNYRHDFYVEESYVIQWMYPYLSPHGLIMKINRERAPLSEEEIRDDMRFWDWYTRRLVSDRKFLRDVVARKSFSKLRSAIGGLYTNRGRIREAESAFQQARAMYPLSPEANFRLAQEVLMPQRRHPEAKELMEAFQKQDPQNTKVPSFIGHIDRLESISTRITELEAQRQSGQMDINAALELADCYLESQLSGPFMGMMGGILNTPNLPAPAYFNAARLLQKAGRIAEMDKALQMCMSGIPSNINPGIFIEIAKVYAAVNQHQRYGEALGKYLERDPANWQVWLSLASLHLGLNQTNEAVKALGQALRVGGMAAQVEIDRNPQFDPLKQLANQRARSFMGVPDIMGTP